MTTAEELIQHFYALRKKEFGFLERLELQQSVDPAVWAGFRLEVDLRASMDLHSPRLLLEFVGVKDLRIGTLEGLLRYILDIRWIGAAQLEGRNYKVVESEYDALSFTCDSFSAAVN